MKPCKNFHIYTLSCLSLSHTHTRMHTVHLLQQYPQTGQANQYSNSISVSSENLDFDLSCTVQLAMNEELITNSIFKLSQINNLPVPGLVDCYSARLCTFVHMTFSLSSLVPRLSLQNVSSLYSIYSQRLRPQALFAPCFRESLGLRLVVILCNLYVKHCNLHYYSRTLNSNVTKYNLIVEVISWCSISWMMRSHLIYQCM